MLKGELNEKKGIDYNADLGPLKWVDLPSCSSTSFLGRAYLRNTVFPPLLQTQNLLLHVGCRGALALSESF